MDHQSDSVFQKEGFQADSINQYAHLYAVFLILLFHRIKFFQYRIWIYENCFFHPDCLRPYYDWICFVSVLFKWNRLNFSSKFILISLLVIALISGTYFLLGWPGVALIVIIPLGIRMGWTTILDETKRSPPKEEIKKSEREWGFDRVFYRLFL